MRRFDLRRRPPKHLWFWVFALFVFVLPWQACGPAFLPFENGGLDSLTKRPGSGGSGNGDVYTGMRSLKTLARSIYQPDLPLAPSPNDVFHRFVKGQQCSANPTGPEHSGALRFLSGEWRLQANACTPGDHAVTNVVSTSYARDVVAWNDQVFGRSESRDDLFTSAYPHLWCRSTTSPGEGLSIVIGEKIIDATPAGDGALTLTFPSDVTLMPRGVTFARPETSPTATYVDATGTIRLATAGSARFDHDPVSGSSLGLLLEEERTNFIPRSGKLEVLPRSPGVDAVVDSFLSPEGIASAESFSTPAGTGSVSFDAPVVASKTPSTFSIYAHETTSEVKAEVTVRYQNATTLAEATFDLATGKVTNEDGSAIASITRSKGRWMRLNLVFDHMAGPAPSIKISFDRRATNPLHLWGAQLESGSYATSFIPTDGAPVKRPADSLTAQNLRLLDRGIGAFFVKFRPLPGQSSGSAFELGDASGRRLTGSATDSNFTLGTNGGAPVSFGNIRGYGDLRVAFATADQLVTGAISGALRSYETPLASGTAPYTSLSIGRKLDGTAPLSGHVSRVMQWNHELAFGTLVHTTGSGLPLPLQGQISLGEGSVGGEYERSRVLNFQVDRTMSRDTLKFTAPDYDFDLVVRTSTNAKSASATIETAIDDKLHRDELTCVVEPGNVN